MRRWIYWIIAAAAVLLVVLYFRKAWSSYTKPQTEAGGIVTNDPTLQRALWKDATSYGESIPLDR